MAYQIDKNKIAKNTIALYIRMGITMVIYFFSARVTLQVLGVNDYGLNNLVGSVVMMFSFINGSMGTAVQRFYSIEIGRKDDDRLKRVFSAGLYCHGIVAFITFILAELFAIFFLCKLNIPSERMYAAQVVFQVSIVQMVLNILSVPYAALLRARERFSSTAFVDIVQALFRLGVLYLLYIVNYDKLISLSIFNLCITVGSILAYIYLARQHNESHVRPNKDKEIIKEMIRFISLLIITVMMQVFRDQGIVLLINLFFGLAINAAYAVAMQIMSLANTFVMNFKTSIVPQMVSSYGAGDKTNMFKLIDVGTKVTFILLLMLSIPFAAEVDFILDLWLKTPPKETSVLVIFVLVNVNIASFTYFFYQAIHATGKITLQQLWTSIIFGLNVFGIFIAFKLGAGFQYALYITIAASILQIILNLYCAKLFLEYDVSRFLIKILFPSILVTILSLVPVLLVINIFTNSVWRLCLTLIISVVVIFASSFAVLFNTEERKIIICYSKKFLNR